jgi:Putative transposase DNA-binding domain
VLGYKVKLYPNRVKADMLALLTHEFQRLHDDALKRLSDGYPAKAPSLKGLAQAGHGEFRQRATRRAVLALQRQRKALGKAKKLCPFPAPLPALKAELLDAAEVQQPRRARSYDYWVHVEGLSRECQMYLPAKAHAALNRALTLPGARLGTSAEIFRRDGQWYARVSVYVPKPATMPAHGVIGCDVGVRAAVTYSDGRQTKGLHRVIRTQRDRLAGRQRQATTRQKHGLSHQCQVLAREARRCVTLAAKTGRGVALEDPSRLIRWRQHAARFFAKRVGLLASLHGVPVALVNPPYTSLTCSKCGSRDSFRYRRMFYCYACGHTTNADRNASVNIAHEGLAVYIRAQQAA